MHEHYKEEITMDYKKAWDHLKEELSDAIRDPREILNTPREVLAKVLATMTMAEIKSGVKK